MAPTDWASILIRLMEAFGIHYTIILILLYIVVKHHQRQASQMEVMIVLLKKALDIKE